MVNQLEHQAEVGMFDLPIPLRNNGFFSKKNLKNLKFKKPFYQNVEKLKIFGLNH